MKFKKFLDDYFSITSRVILSVTLLSVIIFIISNISAVFSDFFNGHVSSFVRFVLSKITGILPFSLGEALFLCLPIFVVVALVLYFKVYSDTDIRAGRFVVTLFCCVCVMFSLFVLSFGVAYNGTELSDKLGLERKDVGYDELEHTAFCLIDEIEQVIDEVDFRFDGASQMPYSFDALNDELNVSYRKISDKYSFIPQLASNVKIIAVSPIMTYTHISGIYTYYTGEANLNVNYPDYTIPYTMAHEMAHQRGIAPENEANFVAFLVCLESDDPYIRYSGCVSMLEYVMSAMNIADPKSYSGFSAELDTRIRGEMIAFTRFFEPYRESAASTVSDAINDTYLKANGQKAGSRSYGIVVDLACAYYTSLTDN